MKQSIKTRHSFRITTPILDLRPPKSVSFLLHLLDNISLPILDKKRALPPLPLPLHPHPMWAVLPPCTPFPRKHPFHINLRIPPILSQQNHLTIQRKSLPQFQIPHQVNIPELKPLACYKLIQLSYQQKNLHQFLLLNQKSTPPV